MLFIRAGIILVQSLPPRLRRHGFLSSFAGFPIMHLLLFCWWSNVWHATVGLLPWSTRKVAYRDVSRIAGVVQPLHRE